RHRRDRAEQYRHPSPRAPRGARWRLGTHRSDHQYRRAQERALRGRHVLRHPRHPRGRRLRRQYLGAVGATAHPRPDRRPLSRPLLRLPAGDLPPGPPRRSAAGAARPPGAGRRDHPRAIGAPRGAARRAAGGRRMTEVVLVTGVATGMGAATADRLTRAGYTVEGCDLIPGDGYATVDVRDTEAVATWVKQVTARHGRIDAVVTFAACGLVGAIEETHPLEA